MVMSAIPQRRRCWVRFTLSVICALRMSACAKHTAMTAQPSAELHKAKSAEGGDFVASVLELNAADLEVDLYAEPSVEELDAYALIRRPFEHAGWCGPQKLESVIDERRKTGGIAIVNLPRDDDYYERKRQLGWRE